MILFINSCVRSESRTLRLAQALLDRLDGPVAEVRTAQMQLPTADEDFLRRRDSLIAEGRLDDHMFDAARQFAAADVIVIAAPYWDLSFPASLKQYLEQVNVVGITFHYTPEGVPEGLCRAKKLYYVTTAGGYYVPEEYGYGYVSALAHGYYGIGDTCQIQAVGLDIVGADVEAIIQEAEDRIGQMQMHT